MDKVKTKTIMQMWLKFWQSYLIDALKLHYRQYSDSGAPLLVLHGLFGSLSNWSWHCKQLAQHLLSSEWIFVIMAALPMRAVSTIL